MGQDLIYTSFTQRHPLLSPIFKKTPTLKSEIFGQLKVQSHKDKTVVLYSA